MKNILRKIRGCKRFEKVARTYHVLSKKYGDGIVIGGGCLVDCFFDLDFYDIDVFVYYKDLKPEYRKVYHKDSRILDVIRDKVDGEDIDIIVLNYDVEEHIRRFDQQFKQIWLNRRGLNITRAAANGLKNREITLGSFNGPVVYFRCIKSSEKYGMKINEEDLFLMKNYLDSLKSFNLAAKYEAYRNRYIKNSFYNATLAAYTRRYSRKYWDLKINQLQTFQQFKEDLKARGIY